MFDKENYWKRRKAGLRGQEYPSPIVARHFSPDWPKKAVGKKASLKNTKRARKVTND